MPILTELTKKPYPFRRRRKRIHKYTAVPTTLSLENAIGTAFDSTFIKEITDSIQLLRAAFPILLQSDRQLL